MIPETIRSLFRRTPVEKAVTDNLHQARLDLLSAQDQAEYWTGMVKVLKTRVTRLEGTDTAAPQVADTPAPQVEEQQ